jgi:hypothetical protein
MDPNQEGNQSLQDQVKEAKKATKSIKSKKFTELSKAEMRHVLMAITHHSIDPEDSVEKIMLAARSSAKGAAAADTTWDLPAVSDEDAEEKQAPATIPTLKKVAAKGMSRITSFSGKWVCAEDKIPEYCSGLAHLMGYLGDATASYINMVTMWVESNSKNEGVQGVVERITTALKSSTTALPVDATELHQLVYALAFPFLTAEQSKEVSFV